MVITIEMVSLNRTSMGDKVLGEQLKRIVE